MSIRVRSFHTDDERRDIVGRFIRSGQTSGQFAPGVGISAYTLRSWRRRFAPDPARSLRALVAPSRPAFVEAVEARTHDAHAAAAHAFEVALPRSVTVRVAAGFDAADLRRIIDALLA